MEVLHSRLQEQYSTETRSLPIDHDSFYEYLISTKLATNLDRIRKQIIEDNLKNIKDATIGEYQSRFSKMEEFAGSAIFASEVSLKKDYDSMVESQRTRRYSIDFDAPPEDMLEKSGDASRNDTKLAEEEDSLNDLRQRLMGKRRGSFGMEGESFDKQMQIQDDLQKELVQDMGQLVSGLKQGAEAFQNAIDHDSTVLKAAEIGLHVTTKNLSAIGTRLKKYHNEKLGFFMKLGLLAFVILGLLVTYLIIKIFPDM